ncbi:hypothetical protein CK203_017728 [Vitis vinifera]|uniref:BED-type domain-containing protein n=1 Tax=Vitis vinifera TaxID=29760 RepID=A0A438JHE0_VITVI|nr:hypothetical protein CK203_017728 [Vitis vinifera]
MASEGGSVMPRRDPAWKYCSPIEGNRNGIICNFCGLVMKSGGITRFKSHLTHKDPHNNIKKCPKVPPKVKEEIRLLVHDKQKAKAKKNTDIEDIRSQLRGTMGTHHTHLVNEDDDDEDAEDEDVYMYPTDMHPNERDAYRSVVRASKASNWEVNNMRILNGNEPPSPYEIKNKYLEMEYKEMEAYVSQQREKWKTYRTTVFLKSVDASNYIKDHKYIYELLKTIIKEVGKENVVQIVIDNGSAFMKAVKQLMKKYNLYWTPCAAHCIDLIFEDIDKRPSVIEVINNARKITNFIYNHGWLLAQMRKYCGGDIVRPQVSLKKILTLLNFIVAYFLNPRFQYRHGVGSDPELLQAVHDVFAKLDPTTESLGQFGNDLVLFRDAKRGFGDRAQLQQGQPWCPKMIELLKKITLIFLTFHRGALNSHQEIDSTSAGHSSRPSVAGILLLVTMVQEVELMMEVIMGKEILMNVDTVNIQSANLLVKMISHTTYRMKTMALEELVQA